MSRWGKLWAVVVSATLVLLVVAPGVRMLLDESAADGFPLSTYPMFSRDPGRIVELPTVVAVAGDGAVERLSPRQIAGTDQVIQASVAVRDAVRDGPAGASSLCAEVAGRVGDGATVAVVVEEHDAIRWAAGERTEPLDRRELARCQASP